MPGTHDDEHRIARLSELAAAPSMKPVEAAGTKILLVRLADGLHAVSGLCPHAQAPLHEGALCGTRLVCPWHQSVFDVTSGSLLEPPSLDGLARYPVRCDGDEVIVTLPPPAPRPAGRPAGEQRDRTVLIVGAGAAGQAAAETLRAEGCDKRVIMVGPEPDAPYDRTNLSKHFLSGQAQRDALPLRRDPAFFERLGVERRVDTVVALDARRKTATLGSGETLSYQAAILATGGAPKVLPVPGADGPRVCLLRSVADAERVLSLLPGTGGRVVVIGGSFIALEAAASLTQRGTKVTVLSPTEIPFEKQLGREIGRSIRRLHERNGVRFLPSTKAASFQEAGNAVSVTLENAGQIVADAVVVGIGVRPATEFVEGVRRDPAGGVLVDEYLQAADGLYAVGDIASFPWPGDGADRRIRIEHWRVAQQHAALAARNIARAGNRVTLAQSGFVPFFWTFHFGQRMNYVGHAERWDEIVFDGDAEQPPFIAYFLREGQTVAAAGTHRDADLAAMHELLRLGKAPRAQQLRESPFRPVEAVR